MADADVGYLLDAESIRQLREDHETLSAIVLSPNRRRLITRGGGGGGSPQPFIITQKVGTDPDEENVAVYRAAYPVVQVKKAVIDDQSSSQCAYIIEDDTEDAEDASCCFLSGVCFTGQTVICQRIRGVLTVTSAPTSHTLYGISNEAIPAGGVGDVRFDGPVGGSALVEATNTLDFQVDAETDVYVMFDDSKQAFYIIAAGC